MTISLPDFDEMANLIDEINRVSIEKSKLELELKIDERNINETVSKDEKYFINGKPPSQTYIDNTWKFTGINNELIGKRNRLSDLTNQLDYVRMKYEFLKMIGDLWRTQEANRRNSAW